MQTEEDWWKSLEGEPQPFLQMAIFADWLDDQEDERAKYIRLMAKLNKFPVYMGKPIDYKWMDCTCGGCFCLGRKWLDKLSNRTYYTTMDMYYTTLQEALLEAAKAFLLLPEEVQRKYEMVNF